MKNLLLWLAAVISLMVAGWSIHVHDAQHEVARDGRSLWGEPVFVQDTFNATWGAKAPTEWVREHNLTLPAAPPVWSEPGIYIPLLVIASVSASVVFGWLKWRRL